MSGTFVKRRVRVEGGKLNFNAAHFITFGGQCEHLHGHNYTVAVELEGELNDDQLVFDFSVLKRLTKEICDELDHHFLLPLHNPHLTIQILEHEYEITYQQKRYIFPLEDVAALPIANSTAECLAEYICHRLQTQLWYVPDLHLSLLTVGVAETPMQTAYYQMSLTPSQNL
jgi:6-pyruvoyltetrahydropterin/6-carboxytetrahydropterin synthase